jgi:multidrug efflux pump subunit AcrA (membrane-fusion protein)
MKLLRMIRALTMIVQSTSAMVFLSCFAGAGDPGAVVVVQNAILKTIETTTVGAQVAGVISQFDVSEGLEVKAGQELGKIRDEAVRLELERLTTAIEIARKKFANNIDRQLASKSLAVAENEYQRALNANRTVQDTYPLNEIDRLKLIADRAKLEVERADYQIAMAGMDVKQAEHEYRKSYEVYTRHRIQAPVTGIVVAIEKHVGEWAEPGTDLLRIVRLDRLRIEGFIPIAQATPDLLGRQAKVEIVVGQATISTNAKVSFITPDVNPVNGLVRIFLDVDNSQQKLRPGLIVKASIPQL